MKKTFKRSGVAVLTMAMLLSMGAVAATTASAAGESIQINAVNGLKDTDAVKIYKVAEKDASGWKWTDNSYGTAVNAAVSGANDFTDLANVNDGAEQKKIATALASAVKSKTADYTTTVGTAESVAEGYYLILVTPSDNSTMVQPILHEIKANEVFTLDAKSEKITLTKVVKTVNNSTDTTKDGNVAADGKNATAKAGDVITYRIVAPIPSYDADVAAADVKPFVLTDTYQNTLTYNSATAVITDSANSDAESTGAAKPTVASDAANSKFTVTLSEDNLLKSGGKFMVVTFKATLGENPIISKGLGVREDQADAVNKSADANKNDVTLTFGNDYITGGYFDRDGDGTEDEDEKPELKDYADVYTTALYVNKTLGSQPAKANNVGFTLYAADGTTVVFPETKTDDNGKVAFKGLNAGTYTLKETTPMPGYKVAGPITITVTEDGTLSGFGVDTASQFTLVATSEGFERTIDNPALESLPGTGGMGTVLFTVGGAAIVLLAGAMFVVYMRKRRNEE